MTVIPEKNPEQLSIKALKAGAKELGIGIKFTKNMTADKAAAIITGHIIANYEDSEIGACGTCGYGTPDLAMCPFCGAQFTGTKTIDENAAPADPPKKKRGRPKGSTNKKSLKSPAKKKGGKKSGKKGEKKAGRPKKADALATIEVTPKMIAEADEIIERVRANTDRLAECAWDIGRDLNEVAKKPGLIKAKGHKTIKEFIEKEFKIGGWRTAYNYMRMAEKFDRDTALQLGVKKADIIASLPEKDQKKYIKKVKAGMSASELQKAVGRKNSTSRSKDKPQFEQKLTILGRLQDAPLTIECEYDDDGTPFARYEIVTGIDQQIVVNVDDGNIVSLTVEFAKVEEAATQPVVVE